MSLRTISLDAKIIQDIKSLTSNDISYDVIFEAALRVLEGRKDALDALDSSEGQDIINKLGTDNLRALTKAVTILLWDCGKSSSGGLRDGIALAIIEDVLTKNELNASFINSFHQKRRLVSVKRSISLSTASYKELSWRLDLEISKRSLITTTEPRFQLRLDLNTQSHDKSKSSKDQVDPDMLGDTLFRHNQRNDVHTGSYDYCAVHTKTDAGDSLSLHLTSDYANMKNIQLHLQAALDELEGVHAQRLTRYIA